jgi:hypothetical protein
VHNSGKLVDLSSALLGAGLARLHPTFQPDRQPGGCELLELEQAAKDKRLKVGSGRKFCACARTV